ncbi:hypothetical protein IPG41_06145 [Candidatus Peregrinibacteria bacterium]|nr:MAG: hypothetical protein IPG41_06145 [Candidatus Peregrinibacteria bacterium]
MLLTESLNQYKQLLEREMRGEAIRLEPGYAQYYEVWKESKKESLPKLSAEERVEHFSDDLEEEVNKRIENLIAHKWMRVEKKKELYAEAKRGDLLLVSTDEGKNFNQVLSLKEVQTLDPLKVRLLSSTLISTTNKYEKVKEEQNLLHIAKTLRDNHCLVQRGFIKEGVAHVEIINPRLKSTEVEVDLNSSDSTFDYRFKGKDEKEKHVPETQLPEAFGLASIESSLGLKNATNATYLLQGLDHKQEDQLRAQKIGAVSSFLASTALQETALKKARTSEWLWKKQEEQSHAQNLQQLVPLLNAETRFISNVLESKKQVAARIALQKAAATAEILNQEKRMETYQLARQVAAQERRAQFIKKQEAYAQAQSNRKMLGVLGAGLTGTLTLSFGGFAWWIVHLTTL